MKLSTRLLLPLLATVALVMSLYGAWALRLREVRLTAEARRETHAYAAALGLAMESAFRDPELRDVQSMIDRISRERTVFGVFVYGAEGEPIFQSDALRGEPPAPRDIVRRVVRTDSANALERGVGGEQVYSVIRPIRDQGVVIGAFEVAQPLSFLREEKASTRQRFLLNTLTLLAAVTILILWLVQRLVAHPLERFVAGARAVGRGDLAYRVAPDPGSGELAELADEFNRMASHLEVARAELLREAEERIALERRLRETEKLAAVGNLAAGLAHEIGAPLHVIRGRADMVLRRQPHDQPDTRNLRIIVAQIERITLIVRNLLDFARRREPRIGTVDIVSVARGAAELLEGEIQKASATFTLIAPHRAEVEGDADLLHQVFVNLFINALHALETSGPDREIICGIHTSDEGVSIEVRDTGPGIPDEILPRIFDPFFTTKSGGQGTGLGLAVARSIIEEQGGSLEAVNADRSRNDGRGGAVFHVLLAAAVPEAQHA